MTTARLATTADLAAVTALFRELRPHDAELTPDQLAALWHEVNDGQRSMIIVAELNGEVGACCMLALVSNLASGGRRIGLIEHVITAERCRRQGLGRQVLEFALQQAWAADCCKVMLLSGSNRPAAHRVYQAIGFNGDAERGFVIKAPAQH